MRSGKLYVIGVGPGDPELMTIKGMRILNDVPCICVPKGREEGSSLALSIVRQVVDIDGKEIVEAYFPMRKTRCGEVPVTGSQESNNSELNAKWEETVRSVSDRLNKGIDTAFITIGDPTIYSTFFYLYDRLLELNPGLNVEIIPGVSSINAASARAKMSLGLADEKIAVLPATYVENLGEIFEKFDTVVLMKVYKVFDKVREILGDMGLIKNAVYISRAGLEDEKIIRNIETVNPGDMNYFSMVIIKK